MADQSASAKSVAKQNDKAMEPYAKMVERLQGKASMEEMFAREDAFEFARQAVNAIAQATTAEELFDASENSAGLASMGDEWPHLNNPINLIEVQFRKSDARYTEGTLGVYAVVHYVLDNGDGPHVVGCGAPNVVAFLETWERLPDSEKAKAARIVVREKVTGRGALLRVGKPA